MFFRWWRLDEDGRRRVWRLYGWFSGLMLCGSCIGAVTWAAWMQRLINNYSGNDDTTLSDAQSMSLFAISVRWQAVFSVTYAMEFLCLSVAELMVLDRMRNFAADGISRRLVVGGRVVLAVVVAGNVVGLGGNVAAAVYCEQAAEFYSTAFINFAANNTADGFKYYLEASSQNQNAFSIASVQSFCEVAVLLLIVIAFALVGVACARRVTSTLLGIGVSADAAAAVGRQLRLRILCTTVFVFVTFLLRSVFSTMYAVANQLQDSAKPCPRTIRGLCDETCYNVFTQMAVWMNRTPEFQLTIVLISSPLSLLVALWGMTSKSMLRHMQSRLSEGEATSQRLRRGDNRSMQVLQSQTTQGH